MAPCFYNFNSCTRAIGKTIGFQNTQDYHWMVAGVELKKHVTGRAMSNRRSEKQSSPYTADLAFKKLLKSQLYLLGLCSNLAAVFCKGCRVQRRKSSQNKFHRPFAPKQRWLPTTAQLHLFPLHLSNEIPKLWSGGKPQPKWTRPQIQWT